MNVKIECHFTLFYFRKDENLFKRQRRKIKYWKTGLNAIFAPVGGLNDATKPHDSAAKI